MMAIAVLGIDLGKNSCSVAGLDGTGRVVLRRRLTRESVVPPERCRPASWRWKPAAEPTTSAASCASRGTRSGSCRRSTFDPT